jgi:hypothetical protein
MIIRLLCVFVALLMTFALSAAPQKKGSSPCKQHCSEEYDSCVKGAKGKKAQKTCAANRKACNKACK